MCWRIWQLYMIDCFVSPVVPLPRWRDWMWFLWQRGIICIQWFLNLWILCIPVRPEPLALTQMRLQSQRKTEGQVVVVVFKRTGKLIGVKIHSRWIQDQPFTCELGNLLLTPTGMRRTATAFKFCFANSETPSLVTTALIMKFRNIWLFKYCS